MARRDQPPGNAGLREYLLAEAQDFRRLMCDTLLDDGAEVAWRECSKAVDQLAAGEPYRLHRFQLPDDHPLAPSGGGQPSDALVLTEDDVLLPAPD